MKRHKRLRKTTFQGLVCLSLVEDSGFFCMFLRFAVAFLENSDKLRFIRGGKKKRPWEKRKEKAPENKKHKSETVYCMMRIRGTSVPRLDDPFMFSSVLDHSWCRVFCVCPIYGLLRYYSNIPVRYSSVTCVHAKPAAPTQHSTNSPA